MKRTTVAALAAVLLLTLTGCAESAGNATEERVAPATSAEQSEPTAAPTTTPAPLVAEAPGSDADAAFLNEVRDRLSGLGAATTIPNATDEQLVAAGHKACETLVSGIPFNDVTVIEGEERVQGSFLDSAAIATAGVLFYCPEMNGNTN